MAIKKHTLAKSKRSATIGIRAKKDISQLVRRTSDGKNPDRPLSLRVQVVRIGCQDEISEATVRSWPFIYKRISQGFHPESVVLLGQAVHKSKTEIRNLLRIPASTFKRRLHVGHLTEDESNRVYRYANLVTETTDMMQGDHTKAMLWLNSPKEILDNQTPLERAMSEVGARDVEELIGRTRHGIFS